MSINYVKFSNEVLKEGNNIEMKQLKILVKSVQRKGKEIQK